MIEVVFETERARKIPIACSCGRPEHEKVITPNYHEIERSAIPHRWKEMRKLQEDYFDALMAEVTEQEIEILKVLRLPSIEEVRKAEILQITEWLGKFRWKDNMGPALTRIFKEWTEELLGTAAVKVVTPMDATMPYWDTQAFALGAQKTFEDAIHALPDWMDETRIREAKLAATLDNPYLRGVIADGGKRIKMELGRDHLKDIRKSLKRMAQEGANPIKVARWIHKDALEGKAWYWRRIARTESALASNAAFDASLEKYRVPYERWSCSATACMICAQFCDQVWKAGDGARPVDDTHPHCACVMRTVWLTDKPIQEPWTRASPYDVPYTAAERVALRQGLPLEGALPKLPIISSAEEGALNLYTGDNFLKINRALNRNAYSAYKEQISLMDSALKKLPDYKGKVIRTVDLHGMDKKAIGVFSKQHQVGNIVRYDQYLSTSHKGYYGGEIGGKHRINMIIDSKTAKKIDKFSRNPDEYEALFGRGSKFKVNKITKGQFGDINIYMGEI